MARIPLQVVLVGTFATVVGIALVGVDYANQYKQAKSRSESFGVGAYLSSITGRYGDMKAEQYAEKERRQLRATRIRELLPPAPVGWTRRQWTPEDEPVLHPRYDMQQDDFVPDEMKNDATLGVLTALDNSITRRKDNDETYVYEAEGEIVSLRLTRFDPGGPRGIAGMGMQIAAANLRAMSMSFGYAMVGGVAFRDERGLFWMEPGAADDDRIAVIRGMIGDEVRIEARARASDASIFKLLEAIDYDRLLALMDHPVEGVGNAQPVLDPETSRLLAEASIRQDDAEMRAAALAATERLVEIGQSASPVEALALILAGTSGIEDTDARRAWTRAIRNAEKEAPSGESEVVEASGGGFFSRIGGFLKGGGATKTAEVKAPVTFTCAAEKGFKRCSAAD